MFVSHKLKEVEYVLDVIIVIRDGKHIADYDNKTTNFNENQLIRDIVGRDLESEFPHRLITKSQLRFFKFKIL